MVLLTLLAKLTPIVDIGLCVLGVIIIIIGNAADTKGTVNLGSMCTVIGVLT